MSQIKTLPWPESLALKPLFDRSPFAEGTYGWFRTLAETTLDKNEDAVVMAIADDSGVIKAALPLAANKNGSLRALTAPYTTRYSPVLTDVHWSKQLGSAAPSYVRNILRLDALDIADPGMAAFLEGLKSSPLASAQFSHFVNWYDHITAFDSYWSARPGKLKSTVERKLSSLTKKHTLRFSWATNSGEMDKALATYADVYRSSWKQAEPHPLFIDNLVRNLSGYHAIRLGMLAIDDKIAAVQIWLINGDKATIFKLAHRQDMVHLSPGTLLTHWMLARLCREENIREVDFGRGDDVYKRDWLAQRRQRFGIVAANWKSTAGCVALVREILPTRFSKLARRIRPRAGAPVG